MRRRFTQLLLFQKTSISCAKTALALLKLICLLFNLYNTSWKGLPAVAYLHESNSSSFHKNFKTATNVTNKLFSTLPASSVLTKLRWAALMRIYFNLISCS